MDHVRASKSTVSKTKTECTQNKQSKRQFTRSPNEKLVLHCSDKLLKRVDLPSRNIEQLPELTSAELLVDLGLIFNLLGPHAKSERGEGFRVVVR